MTRRISAGILGGCLLAIFAMQLPPTSGGGTAQIGWAIGQIFGGSDPAATERAGQTNEANPATNHRWQSGAGVKTLGKRGTG